MDIREVERNAGRNLRTFTSTTRRLKMAKLEDKMANITGIYYQFNVMHLQSSLVTYIANKHRDIFLDSTLFTNFIN